jgi:hypothetical protein
MEQVGITQGCSLCLVSVTYMKREDVPSVCTVRGGSSGQHLWLTYDKHTLMFGLVLVNRSFHVFSTCEISYLEIGEEKSLHTSKYTVKEALWHTWQAVQWYSWLICRPQTAKTRIWFQASSRTDSIGQREVGNSFSWRIAVLSCQNLPTNPLYSYSVNLSPTLCDINNW